MTYVPVRKRIFEAHEKMAQLEKYYIPLVILLLFFTQYLKINPLSNVFTISLRTLSVTSELQSVILTRSSERMLHLLTTLQQSFIKINGILGQQRLTLKYISTLHQLCDSGYILELSQCCDLLC